MLCPSSTEDLTTLLIRSLNLLGLTNRHTLLSRLKAFSASTSRIWLSIICIYANSTSKFFHTRGVAYCPTICEFVPRYVAATYVYVKLFAYCCRHSQNITRVDSKKTGDFIQLELGLGLDLETGN